MTVNITQLADGTCRVDLDYSDEGVALQASSSVIGDPDRAQSWVPVFDADIRRINSHLFPQPEVDQGDAI